MSGVETMMTVGVDLGGTKVAAAAVDENGKLIARTTHKTIRHRGAQAIIEQIVKSVQTVCKNERCAKSRRARRRRCRAGLGGRRRCARDAEPAADWRRA